MVPTYCINIYRPLKLQSLEDLMCGIQPQGSRDSIDSVGISKSAQKLSMVLKFILTPYLLSSFQTAS